MLWKDWTMAWRMCNCTDQMNSVSKQSIMVIITIVSNTYSSIENHGSVKKRLPKWCHEKHEIYHFE